MKKLGLLSLMISVVAIVSSAIPVYAIDLFGNCTAGTNCSVVKQDNLDYTKKTNIVWTIVGNVLKILAGVAVLMIVIGGIRYAISQGDASAVAAAKNTILYSAIGLVVALLATAIVALVNQYFG